MDASLATAQDAPDRSLKRTMELLCLGLTAAGAIAALAGSFVLLPYRVAAVEKAQAAAALNATTDHDAITRIEEDVKAIQADTKMIQKMIVNKTNSNP